MATIIGSKRNKVVVADSATIGNLTITGSIGGYATTGYVTTQISNLVSSAPGTLNTLNELAAALGDDPNFATTIATSIGTKANSSQVLTNVPAGAKFTDTNTTYSVGDNGLTQKNFTTTLKTKLDGIAASANYITNNNQLTNGAGYVTSSGNTIIGTDSDINTSGSTIIDNIYVTDGVITYYCKDPVKR